MKDKPVLITSSEIAELREYISMLESRAAWGMNEVRKYRSSRSIRFAGVFGEIRKAPLNFRRWAAAPLNLLRALSPQPAEIEPIARRKLDFMSRIADAQTIARANSPGSFAAATPVESIYRNTVLALTDHTSIVGIAAPEKIESISPGAAFNPVRPDDFDQIIKRFKATAFVLDLDYAASVDPYWRGVLSMANIPISIQLARCLETAQSMGLTLVLAPSSSAHRFPFLADVRSLFDVEATF